MPDEEAVIKKIPPHSTDAERSVIGSMLLGKEAVTTAVEMLEPDDFYNRQYGVIFEAMRELSDGGRPVDIVTLSDELKKKNLPEELTSMTFASELINAVPTSTNVRYYAEIVKEKAQLRRLIQAAAKIETDCYLGQQDTQEIMDQAEKNIFAVLQQRSTEGATPIREIVLNQMDAIENASRSTGHVTGLETGFTDLDYKTSGFQN